MKPKPTIELARELDKVDTQRRQPGPKLNDIEPPFADFDFADRGLPASETSGEIGLAKAHRLSGAAKQLKKDFVVTAVQGLQHGDLSPATLAQSSTYSEWESKPHPRVGPKRGLL